MGAGDFNLSGTANEALFGFGDALCVPVLAWIAENYLNPVLDSILAQEENMRDITLDYAQTA